MDDRKFTIQEVEAQTQVPAATLRQWERRYGFPKPERSDNGYRLFSSFDMQQIEAMRDYIEDGMASSQAAKLVQYQLAKPLSSLVGSFDKYTGALTEAFLNLDEAKANQVLSEAHALHSVSDVFTHILQASVFDLGEKWHAGEIDIATEHFASNYAQARLRSLLNSQPEYAANTTIIVACAPFEQHELGALMLAVMLRQAAYHVIYLGANTPVKDLKILSERSKATAVLISITTETALKELLKEAKLLPNLAPFVALGGNIVNSAAFDP
ncbi:MAG: MerR family transcriptional regulator, partial [Trueperaceae bacterium]|nr:MerR family transcriptional regulator [Trueperaceae bacterium]